MHIHHQHARELIRFIEAVIPGPSEPTPTTRPPTASADRSDAKPGRNRRRQQPRTQHEGPTTSRSAPRFVDRDAVKEERVQESSDLVESLRASLGAGSYECMVCYDKVRPHHKIWTCFECCHAAFHIKFPDSSVVYQRMVQQIVPNTDGLYGPPGTRLALPRLPAQVEDVPGNKFITPHSCGNPCLRGRDCAHRCTMECHPGPCRPCELTAPPVTCFCGKNTFVYRCAEVVKGSISRECGDTCDKPLGCGIHRCTQPCHAGACDACPITVDHPCRCGKTTVTAPCGKPPQPSSLVCDKTCGHAFACGHHRCEEICHAEADGHADMCSLDPAAVATCPCGRKGVKELLGRERTSCIEPVPTCKSMCGRRLACGHKCERLCHAGDCPPCGVDLERLCRCGAKRVVMKCASTLSADSGVQELLCDRVCKANRSCKRHRCDTLCCSGTDADHACNAMCGKLLRCGKHYCNFVCSHGGACHDCYEGASFDELACACGATRIMPPIACGTPPPRCNEPCRREQPCGHVSYSTHNCHPDDEPCPPCVIFVEKVCACGRKTMRNIPCSRQSAISCGTQCGKTIGPCGHKCQRFCHSGPCLDAGNKCKGVCGHPRPMCGHACDQPCHETPYCTEDKPCKSKVTQTCPCLRRTESVVCGAWKDAEGKPTGVQIPCDDECARTARNRTLAEALNVNPAAAAASAVTQPVVYEEALLSFAKGNPAVVKTVEATLAEFVANPAKRLMLFPHANYRTNRFVAELLPHYNLVAEVVDAERKMASVVARKTASSVPAIPSPLVSVASKGFKGKAAVAGAAANAAGLFFKVKTSTMFGQKKANGYFFTGMQDSIETKEIQIFVEPIIGAVTVCWVGDKGDCVVTPTSLTGMNAAQIHTFLIEHEPEVSQKFLANVWATHVHLCHMEEDGVITKFVGAATAAGATSKTPVPEPNAGKRKLVSKVGGANMFSFLKEEVVGAKVEEPLPESWEEFDHSAGERDSEVPEATDKE
ncbi:FKBP12-associated protein [Phlyctochytrium bullatum]|nr:FKBP12-associated protein [Phlyctochytrium bullatum]